MSPPTTRIQTQDKTEFYADLLQQTASILDHELPVASNLGNLSSLLFYAYIDNSRPINWAGFYLIDSCKEKLFLGPFQGRIACTSIPLGKGVCGTAAKERATILVENVHNFPGHIACDSASESEIVIPIIVRDNLVGVLDIDALVVSEFDNQDRVGLEAIVRTLQKTLAQEPKVKLLR
jgi:L-methionine (R)-S-oxide reductase